MTIRVIHLPAIDKSVRLGAYVHFVRLAKEQPDRMFPHGLTCWWPCTGKDITEQFWQGVQDRINQAVPYSRRGQKGATHA